MNVSQKSFETRIQSLENNNHRHNWLQIFNPMYTVMIIIDDCFLMLSMSLQKLGLDGLPLNTEKQIACALVVEQKCLFPHLCYLCSFPWQTWRSAVSLLVLEYSSWTAGYLGFRWCGLFGVAGQKIFPRDLEWSFCWVEVVLQEWRVHEQSVQ